MIYLDNSATTPMHPDVINIMTDTMHKVHGNPSSIHGFGIEAENIVEQARKVVARSLRCNPQNIIFTSGGTEANNLAIKGVAHQYTQRGNHIITTQIEHPAVYEVCKQLEHSGWRITYLPVDALGRVQAQDVENELTNDTVLVSIMHVNNEVGTIQPIIEIGEVLKKYPRVFFHVDAVQSFGKIPLFPEEAGIDLMSISPHKVHGPKGVGCLYKDEKTSLFPLSVGGGQEYNLRSGTLNVSGIAGFAKAVLLAEETRTECLSRFIEWKQLLLDRLSKNLQHMQINGDVSPAGGAPFVINLSFPGLKSEVLIHALEEHGLYVSNQSACSSKRELPSRILLAMGRTQQEALGAIRISFGFQTTEDDVLQSLRIMEEVIPKYQKLMRIL